MLNNELDNNEMSNDVEETARVNEYTDKNIDTDTNTNSNATSSNSSNDNSNKIDEEIAASINKMTIERKPYEPIDSVYYTETIKGKSTNKNNGWRKFIVACLVVSVAGGGSLGASFAFINSLIVSNDSAEEVEESSIEIIGTEKMAAEPVAYSETQSQLTSIEVIEKVSPSVVNISSNIVGSTNYYGFSMPYENVSSGSGVIFSEDEKNIYIVTNHHVVEDANEIAISLTGDEMILAEIVGSDVSNDLAVISVNKGLLIEAGISEIAIATFADSDDLKVGQEVIAIGNALGEGKSATDGMISIIDKTIEIEGLTLDVLQTSAAINPGNSGGALVNYNGEIVGINTAKTNTQIAEGMGYAIPSNTVKEIMEQILIDGTIPKPYLGIMGADITEEISEFYKLPVGVLVREVLSDSGSEEGGLLVDDVIVSFAGKSVLNMEDLVEILQGLEIGSVVEMNVIRNGSEPVTLQVEIFDANN